MNLKTKFVESAFAKWVKDIWYYVEKHFDRALYKGGAKQFCWLFGILAIATGIGLAFSPLFHVERWRVIELLLDPGSFSGSTENCGNVWFQFIVTLAGAVTFTCLLINAIGNFMERRIDRIRHGNIAYEVDDHILIIGAGSMLINLIKTLLEKEENGKRDIVILTSQDAEDVRAHVFAEIPKEKARNIYVYYGSRVQKETLNKLDAYQTTAIYILGEDDEPAHDSINMKCYEVLKEVCNRSRRTINCYMVLDRLTSIQFFYYKQDNPSTDKLRLTVVNSWENAAQRVLVSRDYRDGEFYPALDRNGIHEDDNKFVHFVIVGMSQMGYAMATTAAHVCHFPNFPSKGLRTKITFIQNDIRQEMNFFLGRFSELMKLSYWQYINPENPTLDTETFPDAQYTDLARDPKGFLDIEWEFIDSGIETPQVRNYLEQCAERNEETEVLTIALCGNEPETNASAALFLPAIISEKQIPVFVYQPGGDQMMRMVKDTALYAHLYPFGMKTDAFDKQYHERLRRARRISQFYKLQNEGKPFTKMPEDGELVAPWFANQYAFQQSNMYAANSIPFKLRGVAIGIEEKLTDKDIDLLAKIEHNRWNVERLLNGFRSYKLTERLTFKAILEEGDAKTKKPLEATLKKNKNTLFIHKDIAPYEELLPSSQNYDKAIVRNIQSVLKDNSYTN